MAPINTVMGLNWELIDIFQHEIFFKTKVNKIFLVQLMIITGIYLTFCR